MPSIFSSIPEDIVHRILARLPKCYHPMIRGLSKEFGHLIRSPEIEKIRARLSKDSMYLYSEYTPSVMVAVGPEIFWISRGSSPQSVMSVFDSRTGKVRKGPSSTAPRCVRCAAAVERKVYVIGVNPKDEEGVYVEAFDVKTQTWECGPVPEENVEGRCGVALDRMVCALSSTLEDIPNCYNTRDGSCDFIKMAKEDSWGSTGACVIHNILYVYYAEMGLAWYDTKDKIWRKVSNLDPLNKLKSVALGDYYGKLALLWEKESEGCGDTKEVWCQMIGLARIEGAVRGTAETSHLLGSIPRDYRLQECLSVCA
ncbi:unnamed protein product [Eruca vesicaria subsp. sativa]|uniref:F-box domain-containing protein n=1 Tax=Eruca vesicaria subsp. sativa TaxID=29727 RepID=A0ABC8LEG7_ERUVS|nr:unnamed protein product [Eruca vesicaria subsp. sativa]